jgi:hypothetical protein
MYDNTCDTCGEGYDFTKKNSTAYLYPEPIANHLIAKCSKGHNERIYATFATIEEYRSRRGIEVKMVHTTPKSLIYGGKKAWKVDEPLETDANAKRRIEMMTLWRSPRREADIDKEVGFFAHLLEKRDPLQELS